jgi:hypothetical protein
MAEPAPRSQARRHHGAAGAAAAPAAAPPQSEAAFYAPDADAVTIDGRRFRLGNMRIGPSLRFTALAVRLMARGEQAARTMLAIENGTDREAAQTTFSLLTLLPESDLAELVAIALSNDEAVDQAWVIEHWNMDWVLPLLAAFTEYNAIGSYFKPLGKVLVNLQAQMPELMGTTPSPTTPSGLPGRSTSSSTPTAAPMPRSSASRGNGSARKSP